jgi:hypothetical protein
MSVKVWSVKLAGNTYQVKALKSNVLNFVSTARSVQSVAQRVKEISNYDGKEHTSIMYTLFGPSGTPIANPDKYAADRDAWIASLPVPPLVIDQALIDSLTASAQVILDEHTPVKDSRETDEQRAERKIEQEKQYAENAKLQAEREANDPDRNKERNINTISTKVKAQLLKEFPGTDWSVTVSKYSGGRSMTVALMAAPFSVFQSKTDIQGNVRPFDYAQLNQYQLRQDERIYSDEYLYVCNGTPLTLEGWTMLKRADEIANADNWNHSDSQTDYYDVNYGCDLHIGKWDKAFQVREAAAQSTDSPTTTSADGITVRRNIAQDGVEVAFPAKPAQSVIDTLKSHGFRWSFKNHVWYKRYSESVLAFAQSLAGQPAADQPAIVADELDNLQEDQGMMFAPTDQPAYA